ncbi:MAG TPA: dihydrolipoamide acetyltransferase family protein [Acidimicrobiales bacterium]|nr:dihydrolipoamide acetyltransferase family protein [Acidimicrobiales bacterium]
MGEFRMPSLGADMEAGTILEWRVHPGDTVHRGDIVAVVDTEKATIDVEVFEDGVVEELLVEPGVQVPVGAVLARIASPTAAEPRSEFVRASPRARREAKARGVPLADIAGTGPGGAVVVDDVAAPAPAAPAPAAPAPAAPAPPAHEPDTRRAIAAAMARSKREVPHYYLATTIDAHAALSWLDEYNAERSVADRIVPAALLLKATALALHDCPVVNGFWRDGFTPSTEVHLGVAVALRGGGLLTPSIQNADQLSVAEVMVALRGIVTRARENKLRSSDMGEATATVTNLGDQGVEEVFGIIFPPQVALVGFGKIVERPWAADGMLGVRPVVRATLSADHRASDGHDGAHFLTVLDGLLQRPDRL